MKYLLWFGGYVLVMIGIGLLLKNKKNSDKLLIKNAKGEEIEVPDYENDPQYSYMTCNKYNPESPFYYKNRPKKQKKLFEFDYEPNLEINTYRNIKSMSNDIKELKEILKNRN